MAQDFDPPWRLDPLKRIINVGWGGSIAVLAMSARIAGSAPASDPPVSWNAFLTAACDDPDMRGLSLLEESGPLVAPPGPPSVLVTSQNDVWCYEREFSETSEIVAATYHFVDRGKYVIFTSSGVITLHYDALDPVNPDVPFLIDFHSPPDLSGGDGLAVLPGNNQGNLLDGYIDRIVNLVFSPRPTVVFPQLVEEIISHNEVVSTRQTEKSWATITFLNLPRIASRWPSHQERRQAETRGPDAGRELSHLPRVVSGAGYVCRDQEICPQRQLPAPRVAGSGQGASRLPSGGR